MDNNLDIQALSQLIDDVELQNLFDLLDLVKQTETPQGLPTQDPEGIALERSARRKEIAEILEVFLEKEPLYFPYFLEFKRQYWSSLYANFRDMISIKRDIIGHIIEMREESLYRQIIGEIGELTEFDVNNLVYQYVFLEKKILAYNYYTSYFFKCITYENIAYQVSRESLESLEKQIRELAKPFKINIPKRQDYQLPKDIINKLPDPNSQQGMSQIAYRRPRATIEQIQEGIEIARKQKQPNEQQHGNANSRGSQD